MLERGRAPGWCSPIRASRRILGEAVAAAPPASRLPHARRRCRAERPDPPPVVESDLALVQFSSGTTVEPKPVALSHRAVVAQVRHPEQLLGGHLRGARTAASRWLPLYHDMGLIGCVFPALARDASSP